jgi:alpha-beta hydrolase superfamily lysophospholipase
MNPSAEFDFTSDDGLRIAGARWDSQGAVRGIVQIAHDMGEHIRRYDATIEALASEGLTVYGHDHRGHGRTAPSTLSLGDLGSGGFEALVDDVFRLTRIVRTWHPGVPLILLGHGLGAFAAQRYVLDYSFAIDGLVLSGTGALDGLARLARSVPKGTDILNAHFEPARTPFDWLSRDSAVVDAFINDPLCFAVLRPESYASFLCAAPRLADPIGLRRIRRDLPVYIFSGSEDPVGEQLAGVRVLLERYRAAGIFDIAHDFYAGGRHEMLNEINRAEVVSRLLGWISGALEGRKVAANHAN